MVETIRKTIHPVINITNPVAKHSFYYIAPWICLGCTRKIVQIHEFSYKYTLNWYLCVSQCHTQFIKLTTIRRINLNIHRTIVYNQWRDGQNVVEQWIGQSLRAEQAESAGRVRRRISNRHKELHPVINITNPACLTDFTCASYTIDGGMWLKLYG